MCGIDLSFGLNSSYKNYTQAVQDIQLVQSTAPTFSLVTRSEAKNYLKIGSYSDDDDLIDSLIVACTGIIEKELGGISLCEQTWTQYQKGGVEKIKLLRTPVIGIPSVSYYSSFDTTTATNITYTTSFRVVENKLVHSSGFFEAGRDLDGYTITFKSGKFTADNYTTSQSQELQAFKTIINRTIAYFYENREEYATEIKEGEWTITYDGELPTGIKRLIMPYHSGMGLI